MQKASAAGLLLPSRRTWLRHAAASAALVAAPALLRCSPAGKRTWANGDPFSLGVASGAPSSDGFVLWTRLAPQPLNPNPAEPGGMSGNAVAVDYEIADDAGMRNIIRRGVTMAEPEFAYSAHVEISGLRPGREYWYRFTCGEAQSRVGRAITTPLQGAPLAKLRLGFVSCSHYEEGYFSAYRHLANENPDVVLFLGDYIYEYLDLHPENTVRKHSDGVESTTLPTYRNRYAQYRMDADLQRLHAEVTSLITWDDHEVQNDYADQWSQDFADPKDFLKRRASAYRAFYEHMPVRALSRPQGPAMRIYDRFTFGDLAEISMVDGRQYRSREACYGKPKNGRAHSISDATCPERLEAARTMMGAAQEAWLYEGLAASKARWNVIGQDMLMAQLLRKEPAGIEFWSDDWNGYPANRARLLQHIHDANTPNPVVFGGDIHSFWTNDLKLDFNNPASPTIASEFIGTSITANKPATDFRPYLGDNPHIRYFEDAFRGYVSVDIEPGVMHTRYRAISDRHDPNATISTLKSFVVEDGRPGPTDA